MTHKDEIPCSESALYRYIDKGFLSAKNIDLPRRVRFKVRKKHEARSNIPREHLLGRLFTDFETYLKDNPEANIWEMDTVIGSQGGKCLLTLLYRKTNLMIAILLEKHTHVYLLFAEHSNKELCILRSNP